MRERLLRGLEAVRGARRVAAGFLGPHLSPALARRCEHALEVVDALEEGYRLSLSALDDLLSQFQVRPIECKGKPSIRGG